MPPRVLVADGIVTGDREAIVDGAVVLAQDCTVLDVGRAEALLPQHAGADVERIRGVLVPGLVNAHVHVELSALAGRVRGGAGFLAWLEGLVATREEASPEEDRESIASAVDRLDAMGTVAVGEVTNTLAAVPALARRGLAGCVFHEVLGLRRSRAHERIRSLPEELERVVGAWPTRELTYAPSPHTLYTTHPYAVRELVRLARARGSRASVHLAEHAGERRALEHGDGPVAAWLETKMKLQPDELPWPRRPLFDYADELGVLSADVLAVHVSDARPEELARLSERGSPVVLCPRSNLYIDVRLPPLLAALQAGIEPALGTDSLASNASLDVLAEARALADRFPAVPARALLQMATWNGARALGREDLGRIAHGARPGIFAIAGDADGDPCGFVLKNLRAPRRWVARRTLEAPC